MYEEKENKIEWGPILKRLGMILAVIIVIFGIVTLVSKCSKKEDKNEPDTPTTVNLENQLNELQRATLEYFTKDNVPTELNGSKVIRLKILTSKNIITGITDDEGNKCDVNESYSEITRLENNYAVKMSLTCGTKNKASRVIYVGCFEGCNGNVCLGSENQTGGICGATTTPDDNNNQQQTANPTTPTTTPNKPTTTTKPSTTTKPNTNTNTNTNTNNNSNSNNNNSNTNNVIKEVLYEYRKCTTTPSYCSIGSMNSNGDCERMVPTTVKGTVLKVGGGTTRTAAKLTDTKTMTVYFTNSSQAKNTIVNEGKKSTHTSYKLVKLTSDYRYQYTKTVKTYTCTSGTADGTSCIVSSAVKYECQDPSFRYNTSTGECTKVIYPVEIYPAVPGRQTCETTWSKSTSLAGWTRTGNTK